MAWYDDAWLGAKVVGTAIANPIETVRGTNESVTELLAPVYTEIKAVVKSEKIQANIKKTAVAATAANLAAEAAASERAALEERNIELMKDVDTKSTDLGYYEEALVKKNDEFDKEKNKLTKMIADGEDQADIDAQRATVDNLGIESGTLTDEYLRRQTELEDLKKELEANTADIAAAVAAEAAAAEAANAANALAKDMASKTELLSSFGGKIEGAAGRKRLLAQQQCFLLYNNHFFVKKHKELLDGSSTAYQYAQSIDKMPKYNFYSPSKPSVRSPSGAGQPTAGKVQTSPGYYSDVVKSTKIILVDDVDQTNDSTIVNRIKVKKNQEEFDNITPAEYAQLIPTIRLYKVNYDKGKSSQHAIEFKFNNKINVEDISAVNKTFEGSIRGDGAGVKSFEWSYMGSDSFTATRDLKATLKLHFQNFGELKKERTANFLVGKKVNSVKYRYLDLVIQSDCGDRDEDDRVIYDPGCYEILAEVGYASPSINATFTTPNIREAINSSKEHLYLVMTDHSFEFEQDGTFSMTINYRARLGSQMASRKFNVLLPAGGNDPGGVQTQIREMKKAITDLKEDAKDDVAAADPAAPAADQDKSPLEEKQQELDEYLGQQRMRFYNIVYSSLRNRRWIHGTQIPMDDQIKYLNYDQKVPSDKKTAGAAGVDQFIGLPDTLPDNHPVWYDMDSATRSWDDMMDTSGKAGTTTDVSTAAAESQLDRLKRQYESDANENIRFVYLGDIIAVVNDWIMGEEFFGHTNYLDNRVKWSLKDVFGGFIGKLRDGASEFVGGGGVTSEQQVAKIRESFHIILGNIEIKNFETGETRLVNMAHIPISLEAFLNFMTKKVVAKKREVYLFSSFVNDLLSDLVMRNLSTKCFGGLVAGSVRTAVSMIEINSENPGKEPIAGGGGRMTGLWYPTTDEQLSQRYNVLHPDQIGTGKYPVYLNPTIPSVTSGPLKGTYDYLLVNSVATKPKLYGVWDVGEFEDKHGTDPPLFDRTGDKKRGIPHYTFGQNAGILKTVNFAKTDQEFLPEARYEQEGSSAINQLAAVYDVTFEMLGTARFQPGQYIYFDPVTMGVGKPWQTPSKTSERSFANLMGLGGYHLVIEVASNIQRGEFVTTLKTRWTTSGCHPTRGCPE